MHGNRLPLCVPLLNIDTGSYRQAHTLHLPPQHHSCRRTSPPFFTPGAFSDSTWRHGHESITRTGMICGRVKRGRERIEHNYCPQYWVVNFDIQSAASGLEKCTSSKLQTNLPAAPLLYTRTLFASQHCTACRPCDSAALPGQARPWVSGMLPLMAGR